MNNKIAGTPTKEFFINMLTRDIPLSRAILDLIDNCIDGAKSIRRKEDYKGLTVNITLNQNEFIIQDNCGGFSLETAKEYAFRFGRPDGKKFIDHSIGRFGVGMKRALFKLGKEFTVESKNLKDHFRVSVNVDNWLYSPEDWDFEYQIVKDDRRLVNDGTLIKVDNLYENISIDFNSNAFLVELKKEMQLALYFNIIRGLDIFINKQKIERKDISFLLSNELIPAYKELIFGDNPDTKVTVRIFCGIGIPSPSEAGWYIFCNERLVLEADKSYNTGWKESNEDDTSVLKFHNQYAMFRGVVMFDSKNSSNLPMTTTKTGIDAGHSTFKSTRPHIITLMKQVTGFLGKIEDRETRDGIVYNSDNRSISRIIEEKTYSPAKFKSPELKSIIKQNKEFTGVSYRKKTEDVEKLKEYLNVATAKEVGESTFDFFVKMNNLDE